MMPMPVFQTPLQTTMTASFAPRAMATMSTMPIVTQRATKRARADAQLGDVPLAPRLANVPIPTMGSMPSFSNDNCAPCDTTQPSEVDDPTFACAFFGTCLCIDQRCASGPKSKRPNTAGTGQSASTAAAESLLELAMSDDSSDTASVRSER